MKALSLSLSLSPPFPSSSDATNLSSRPPTPPPGSCSFKVESIRSSRIIKCNAISKPPTQAYSDVLQSGVPVIKWQQFVEDDIESETTAHVLISKEIEERVNRIKSMLSSMDDGDISISAYDTAWVALIPRVLDGVKTPLFPSSLEWIAQNQLPDGSWGDSGIFSAHDRILSTLACVLALNSWKVHPDKSEKGMVFLNKNISKLEDENAEHMLIGFEVAFPSLMEFAKRLNLQVPTDSPVLQEINHRRNIKLTRIPKEIMHKVPTTLLHSLEGMEGMEGLYWGKLLKLQAPDGSFLKSPASTAFAFMKTNNSNCLKYLESVVNRFNGGVPNVYPVDLFEHIWSVDRLQRLGVSRFFHPEIVESVDYVRRHWTDKGICWARDVEFYDIDDTAMGFKLLRQFGHEVSAEVFKNFEKDGEFVCIAGQSTQAVTGMFNLYRASDQVMFLGEKILEDAKKFSYKFLRAKQAADELLDKWIITKDLPGEVGYALDVPWFASLPRVETRYFIEQYGGENDIWIGKTLYRMFKVNNDTYLELAKLDYNKCQLLHQNEWVDIQKWYTENSLRDYGMRRTSLLFSYFGAACSIFEPERAKERLAWTKTAALVGAIESHFKDANADQRRAFVQQFINLDATDQAYDTNAWRAGNVQQKGGGQGLVGILLRTLTNISLDILVSHGLDITHHLHQAWEKWLFKWQEDGDVHKEEAELLVGTIILNSGCSTLEDLLSNPQYQKLSYLTNKVCHQLGHFKKHKVTNGGIYKEKTENKMPPEIEEDMRKLMQMVIQNSSDGNDIDSPIKNIFLTVAKSSSYAAYFDPWTINYHIAKVLFERVF
ncbi:ent-copalyl diphosphate synthase, chloroplastic isoform X2 [Cucurbita pepo subsp. pepo]|uniref:ent-copalyl diphosphate synthase, chloroplastic isoform X2 n=1 Tax=Cucurbita pepo subsp. pepo TaxID=3664 RepID=UPI000C9D7333|nr:ent-copalyl diphosphate synthase, chloroplastic isoform X2 [Cucurbita pepo subsp. pepo]